MAQHSKIIYRILDLDASIYLYLCNKILYTSLKMSFKRLKMSLIQTFLNVKMSITSKKSSRILIFNSKSIILKELVFIKLWKYFMALFWRNNKYLTIHLYFIRTAGTCMWFLFKIFTQFPLKDLSKFVWMWITLSTIVATGVWKIQLKCKEV